MLIIHLSHAGESPLQGTEGPIEVPVGTVREIIAHIDSDHEGFSDLVLADDGNTLGSNAALYTQVYVDDGNGGAIYESEATDSITDLSQILTEDDGPLLFATFNADHILRVLEEALTETDERFHDTETSTRGRSYRTFIDTLPGGDDAIRATEEPLFPFVQGSSLSDLITNGSIDPSQNALIPAPLKNAISKLWDIEGDLQLRRFQEDALRYILGELHAESAPHPLLLSIPTGGGKTEAFLIPLVAHLFDKKSQLLNKGVTPHSAVRSIVMYPTRALANDQAQRIAEVLYWLNENQADEKKVSIGVLTGDTEWKAYGSFGTRESLLQTCPRCENTLSEFDTPHSDEDRVTARCSCGAEIDFFRFTRHDILHHQPDILVTSPDMINRMLQSPRYHGRIFSPDIDVVVFDEIHVYESVFGCNVAHLLRRFEEACGTTPMYTGVSATINNARELACLIFDSSPEETTYLRPRREDEQETEEKCSYLDYDAGATRRRLHATLAAPNKNVTSTLNVVDALGHFVRDPHFRKTLIFANYRNDTDDLIRYLRDQEDRYYETYRAELYDRIRTARDRDGSLENLELTDSERTIIKSIDRWFRRAKDSGALHTPKLNIGWHRGGLERKERIKAVNRFSSLRPLSGEPPIDVMVATRTLELGIDIGDVTTVVNNGSPATTNEYAQRIGRGGRKRDGLALTVVDSSNPTDLYFLRHFDQFARPDSDDFEDAPIIISNPEVLRSHIFARLLDQMARKLSGNGGREVTAQDLKGFEVYENGSRVELENSPEAFGETLFDQIFPPHRFDELAAWIRRESELIPDIAETEIDRGELRAEWTSLLVDLHDKMYGKQREIEDHQDLSGMSSVYDALVPNLRSSGPSVDLLLVREGGDDEKKDSVPLRQAIRSHPRDGHASQGSISFEIYDYKTENLDEARSIKYLFRNSNPETEALARYYHRMFGKTDEPSPFPKSPIDVPFEIDGFVVPEQLSVKYYPHRFYCASCGATYSHKQAGDDRCTYCRSELRQLTEIYMCGGCGRIFDPPVPKVCLNPNCVATASDQQGITFMEEGYKSVGKSDKHNDYFRFTALPELHWRCRRCQCEFNYHQFYNLPDVVQNKVADAAWNRENPSPEEMAKQFLYQPESYFYGKSRYLKEGFHKSRFSCPYCKKRGTYKKIFAKNIPSIRTEIHDYLLDRKAYAADQDLGVGAATYPSVTILSLGREYYQRFYSYSENTTEINHGEVFPDDNRYLAHRYDTHAVYLDFGKTLDPFLDASEQASACEAGSCSCAPYDPGDAFDDEGEERTNPQPRLLDWERNRKPDPRRKWCDVVQGKVDGAECPDPQGLQGCAGCQHFKRRDYLRYLIIHTLKHAIILAMPRYTGINRFDVQGKIYPNDRREVDLALLDQTEGGSGSLYLFRKNWVQIWEAAGDLLEVAVEDDGRLVLAHGCSRYNCDLCPELALAYYRYADEQAELTA
jgi:ATP-dependent helicase YprA (DUF1998 family)